MTISPARTIVTVAPGSATILQLSITNEEGAPMQVVPVILGARQDEKGRPIFEKQSDVAEGWTVADQNSIDVAAGQTKKIVFTITVPARTGPGSHYLGVGIEPVVKSGGTVSLGTRLLSLVTMYVAGPATEKINLVNWSPDHSLTSAPSWPFRLEMKNEGTVDVSTQARFNVKGWNGKTLFSQEFSTGNKILPESIRQLYPVVEVGDEGWFWPGRYQIEAVVDYGATGQEVRATQTIWYVPWSAVGAVCIAIGAVGFVAWRLKR